MMTMSLLMMVTKKWTAIGNDNSDHGLLVGQWTSSGGDDVMFKEKSTSALLNFCIAMFVPWMTLTKLNQIISFELHKTQIYH